MFKSSYCPALLVTSTTDLPVFTLLKVTLALTITEPDGSLTVPTNDPVVDCACAVFGVAMALRESTAASDTGRTRPERNVKTDMHQPHMGSGLCCELRDDRDDFQSIN